MKTRIEISRIERLVDSIRTNGRWPDINYKDVSRTGFEHGRHLSNLVELSRAYRKAESTFKGNRRLKKTIDSALNHWLDRDYICENWWWNQIGTPRSLVRVLLIMDEELTAEQKSKAAPIVGRAHLNASGARPSGDRIKIAGILAKHLLFKRDGAEFDRVIEVIEGQVKFATGRGMQHDYSFHHRRDGVNNTLSYGLGYAATFAEWASYVAGTKYAFSQEKQQHLIDYYLDGICKMMVHGKSPDPGAKNRSISRQGTLSPRGTSVIDDLLRTSRYRERELSQIARIRRGQAKPNLTHSTFFWHCEYYSHQRPEYFASVRMFSSRNHNMEQPYNSEGLMNHHLGDGSNFISRTGDEYYDIAPVLDWQKIPGTTVVQKPVLPTAKEIQKRGLTDFVGAVTDGRYGAVAFDFKSPHDPLEARKGYFFFDSEYVCLGAGITSSSEHPVATTLNQCLLRGDVVVNHGGRRSVLQHGRRELSDVRYVSHDGVGYYFPKPAKLSVSNEASSGSWYRINHQSDSPRDTINRDIFKLWLDHGRQPHKATYQYMIVPSTTEQELPAYLSHREIDILANSPDIQAVRCAGLNIFQVIFYRAGDIKLAEKLELTTKGPAMVMLQAAGDRVEEITVSDPTRKLDRLRLSTTLRIRKAGNDYSAVWNPESGTADLTIDLPQGVYAGKSVTIDF
jgi:chondroitin AC lyase